MDVCSACGGWYFVFLDSKVFCCSLWASNKWYTFMNTDMNQFLIFR